MICLLLEEKGPGPFIFVPTALMRCPCSGALHRLCWCVGSISSQLVHLLIAQFCSHTRETQKSDKCYLRLNVNQGPSPVTSQLRGWQRSALQDCGNPGRSRMHMLALTVALIVKGH